MDIYCSQKDAEAVEQEAARSRVTKDGFILFIHFTQTHIFSLWNNFFYKAVEWNPVNVIE